MVSECEAENALVERVSVDYLLKQDAPEMERY